MQEDDYDPMDPPSASFLRPTPAPPPNLPREPRSHRRGRLRRHERSQSQPAQPIYGIPTPVTSARGVSEFAPSLLSPPRREPSPATEAALLPGGGVEVPPGFKFNVADQGHYRARARDLEDGAWTQPRVLGGLGFGMLRGLKKFPAAIVKAGRSYGPRGQGKPDLPPLPEEQASYEVPVQDEVETYVEHVEEEEEGPVQEDQLLREYIQRRRMRRDRAQRHRSRRAREPHYVPAPQPVLVPGARTPAASAAPSQTGHSQPSRGDAPITTLEAQLEAEELQQERDALAQAQARERARHVYAASAVKPPQSSITSHPRSSGPETPSSHRRATSQPSLPNHVFSRWSADRDLAGRRRENRLNEGSTSTSPLSVSGLLRIVQQIRDMPWVGDRVAADYIPGGVRRDLPSSRYPSSPRSGSTFSSSAMRGGPGSDFGPPPHAHLKPGQSWYTAKDSFLVLPEGMAPPPGFVPYPFPVPHMQGSTDGDTRSASSHTHTDALAPIPAHANGEPYRYMPAEASATGQAYIFVPMPDGQHQPLAVPGAGGQPGYVYSHSGPPSVAPPA